MKKRYYIFDTNAIIAICLSFPRKWESIPTACLLLRFPAIWIPDRGREWQLWAFGMKAVEDALSYTKFILLIKEYSYLKNYQG